MTIHLPTQLWFERPYDALRASAEKWPRHSFLAVLPETARHYGIEPREYTYLQSLVEVEALRAAYSATGVQPGQRVGVMLENQPEFFFHWLALNALSVSIVPLNVDWRGAELEYVIAHSEMVMAIGPAARKAGLSEAALRAARVIAVATPDEVKNADVRLEDTRSAVHVAHCAGVPIPRARAGDENFRAGRSSASVQESGSLQSRVGVGSRARTECALLYTSGTTGQPKGCVLPNEYFIWAGQWYATVGGLCEVRAGAERMLTPLPTAHMNALAYSTLCMLLTGGCLIALDRFHPKPWWASVRESRATIVHYLGVMPAMLLSAPASAADREHSVRFGFGAGVSAAHHRLFEERFGFPLLEAWAMTETGAGAVVIANREPRDVGTACFGQSEPAVELRIGEDDAVDVPGELLVRAAGPEPRFGFFDRYLKDPEATEAAWDGGWFHTGDIVRRDAHGQLHFVDRKKNVIRRSGENISAVEVESALAQHPLIAAIAVAGVPDAVRGEEVLACVIPHEPLDAARSQQAAEDIVRFALTRLAYYKPPGYIHFCETLPRTATEKIQRGELKRLAQEALAATRVIDTRHLKVRGPV